MHEILSYLDTYHIKQLYAFKQNAFNQEMNALLIKGKMCKEFIISAHTLHVGMKVFKWNLNLHCQLIWAPPSPPAPRNNRILSSNILLSASFPV